MLKNITKSARKLIYPFDNVKLIVLGHQKTGTTAIAHLLSRIADLHMSSDPLYELDHGYGLAAERLISRPDMIRNYCRYHPILFGQPIIKEPDFIYIYPEVKKCFSNAKYLFVTRDPRDTIRSICNRLGISGASQCIHPKISDMRGGNRHWELILSGYLPGIHGDIEKNSNFIAHLAYRWNLAAEMYLEFSDEIYFIRYEDFNCNKELAIRRLADNLEISSMVPISEFVDVQYQPKGDHALPWDEFFGQDNLRIIERISANTMCKLGYEC